MHDIVHALIDLGARLIRQQLVDDPLVQPQLAPVAGDLEHIVLGRVHRAAVYQGSAFRERLHHFLLLFGGLGHDVVVRPPGAWQVQLVGGFNVRDLLKEIHQLWQVEKLAESCSCPVAGSSGASSSAVTVSPKREPSSQNWAMPKLLQAVILEIPLHGVKLGHRVGNRRAGGKDDAPLPVISSM